MKSRSVVRFTAQLRSHLVRYYFRALHLETRKLRDEVGIVFAHAEGMQNEKLFMLTFAAALTTLARTPEGISSGELYATLVAEPFNISLNEYEVLLDRCKIVGVVAESNHYLTITSKGKVLAEKILKMVDEAK